MREGDHLGQLDIDGRIILKGIFKKYLVCNSKWHSISMNICPCWYSIAALAAVILRISCKPLRISCKPLYIHRRAVLMSLRYPSNLLLCVCYILFFYPVVADVCWWYPVASAFDITFVSKLYKLFELRKYWFRLAGNFTRCDLVGGTPYVYSGLGFEITDGTKWNLLRPIIIL